MKNLLYYILNLKYNYLSIILEKNIIKRFEMKRECQIKRTQIVNTFLKL